MIDEKIIPQPAVQPVPAAEYTEPVKTNMYAILSFVLGLSQIVLSWTVIPTVLSIVFGHIALKQIKQTNENGRTYALIGLISGYFVLALLLIAVALMIMAFFGAIAVAFVSAF